VVLVALTTIQRTLAVTGIVAACGAGVYALGTTQASGSTGQPVLPATTVASPAVTANGITVTGVGNASGTPSELQLSLSVNTQAASVSTALDAANQDMSRVRDALSAHGVADADLQTSGMSIQPNYSQGGTLNGYQVTESLAATLRHMGDAGADITAASNAGGNATRIDSVSLALSDSSNSLLTSARASAMADAKARATQYANAAGRTLGPVISISEVQTPTVPVPYAASGAAEAAPSAVPISTGTQQVSVTVTVTYAFG
jgi:uncharacterized protein YggE